MKYYKTAIELVSVAQDWKKICIQIAKDHPKVFCDATVKINNYNALCYWQQEAMHVADTKGKIRAIKYIKQETGMGLKESKEEIERIWFPNEVNL